MKLIANFFHDPLDGGFTVIVPSLDGVISEGDLVISEGDTLPEAIAYITEAAELYLEVEHGTDMQGKVSIVPRFPQSIPESFLPEDLHPVRQTSPNLFGRLPCPACYSDLSARANAAHL